MDSTVTKNDPRLLRWILKKEDAITNRKMSVDQAVQTFKEELGLSVSGYAVRKAAETFNIKFPKGAPAKGTTGNPIMNYVMKLDRRLTRIEKELGLSTNDRE